MQNSAFWYAKTTNPKDGSGDIPFLHVVLSKKSHCPYCTWDNPISYSDWFKFMFVATTQVMQTASHHFPTKNCNRNHVDMVNSPMFVVNYILKKKTFFLQFLVVNSVLKAAPKNHPSHPEIRHLRLWPGGLFVCRNSPGQRKRWHLLMCIILGYLRR